MHCIRVTTTGQLHFETAGVDEIGPPTGQHIWKTRELEKPMAKAPEFVDLASSSDPMTSPRALLAAEHMEEQLDERTESSRGSKASAPSYACPAPINTL